MIQHQTSALTAEGFTAFGTLHHCPGTGRREYFDDALATRRASAWPSFSLVSNAPVTGDHLVVASLERHAHSSQTFVPMSASRWLVVVAHDLDGRPDPSTVKAFVATADQAITFHVGTWHLGLHVLDRLSTHAIFMWRDGTAGDESFADVAPFAVQLPTS
ncbi:ureidoglycolate lyase [Polaromonas sp.]|uniref:ureidoglycolate lyase n=1 Tax=Polaromonas sp. TaxID=1869339 RepID=UPI00352A0026